MKLVIANWKAYITNIKEAKRLCVAVIKTRIKKGINVVLCPPFPFLSSVVSRQSLVALGAQDVFWESEGAYTGEVTLAMLKEFGVSYVIIGHSERRRLQGETDEVVNKKAKAALKEGFEVVVCVGEKERDDLRAVPKSVGEQVKKALEGVMPAQYGKVIVAYEPIWAIGTGTPDTPNDALSAALYIKKIVTDMAGQKAASTLRVLYGGSVNAGNVASFVNQEGIDGVLVGKASTDKNEFLSILDNI